MSTSLVPLDHQLSTVSSNGDLLSNYQSSSIAPDNFRILIHSNPPTSHEYQAFLKNHHVHYNSKHRTRYRAQILELLKSNGFASWEVDSHGNKHSIGITFADIYPESMANQPSFGERRINDIKWLIGKITRGTEPFSTEAAALREIDSTYIEPRLENAFYASLQPRPRIKTEPKYIPLSISANQIEVAATSEHTEITPTMLQTRNTEGFEYDQTFSIADNSQVLSIAVLGDNCAATGQNDNNIYVWDLKARIRTMLLNGHQGAVIVVSALSNERLASLGRDRVVFVWNLKTGLSLGSIGQPEHLITCMAVLPNGQIITGGRDKVVRFWDSETFRCLQTIPQHDAEITAITPLANGTLVAIAMRNGKLYIRDSLTGTLLHQLAGHTSAITAVTEIGDYLASASEYGEMRIWDYKSGKCVANMKEDTVVFTLLALNDHVLLVGKADKNIDAWDINIQTCVAMGVGHTDYVQALTKSSDGNFLSGSEDKALNSWHADLSATPSINLNYSLKGEAHALITVTKLSRNRVALGDLTGLIYIWDRQTSSCVATLHDYTHGHTNAIFGIVELDNGQLVTASADDTLKVWNPEDWSLVATIVGHGHGIYSMIKLPRTEQLPNAVAVGFSDGFVGVFDMDSLKLIRTLTSPDLKSAIDALTIFNNELAGGSWNRNIYFWDYLNSGNTTRVLRDGHDDWVRALLPISDRQLVSASYDSTMVIWDVYQATRIETLTQHTSRVRALTLLSGGRFSSASDDEKLCTWDSVTHNLLGCVTTGDPVTYGLITVGDSMIAVGEKGEANSWIPSSIADDKITFRFFNNKHLNILDRHTLVTNCTQEDINNRIVENVYDDSEGYPGFDFEACMYGKAKCLPPVKAKINFHPNPISRAGIVEISVGGALGVVGILAILGYLSYLWRRHKLQLRAMQEQLEAQQQALTDGYTIDHPEDLIRGRILGGGTSGWVYEGTWQGMQVAIKVIHIDDTDLVAQNELEREVSIMAKLRHENLVRFFGFCKQNDGESRTIEYNLVMNLARQDLKDYLQTHPNLSWKTKWEIAVNIINGLNLMHYREIIHNDLKSLNVFIGADGHAMIGDFGSAVSIAKRTNRQDDTDQTQVAGTPFWMAPELLAAQLGAEGTILPGVNQSSKPTFASDIYSLGIILCEIAAQNVPYPSLRDTQLDRHDDIRTTLATGQLKPIIPDGIPRDFAGLIRGCIEFDPNRRFTMGEIVQRILARDRNSDELPPTVRVPLSSSSSFSSSSSSAPTRFSRSSLYGTFPISPSNTRRHLLREKPPAHQGSLSIQNAEEGRSLLPSDEPTGEGEDSFMTR